MHIFVLHALWEALYCCINEWSVPRRQVHRVSFNLTLVSFEGGMPKADKAQQRSTTPKMSLANPHDMFRVVSKQFFNNNDPFKKNEEAVRNA